MTGGKCWVTPLMRRAGRPANAACPGLHCALLQRCPLCLRLSCCPALRPRRRGRTGRPPPDCEDGVLRHPLARQLLPHILPVVARVGDVHLVVGNNLQGGAAGGREVQAGGTRYVCLSGQSRGRSAECSWGQGSITPRPPRATAQREVRAEQACTVLTKPDGLASCPGKFEPTPNTPPTTPAPPHLRLGRQLRVEQLQLLADGSVVAHGVGRGAVHHVHQQPAALAVPQELVAQAHPRVRALQQARHVCRRRGVRGTVRQGFRRQGNVAADKRSAAETACPHAAGWRGRRCMARP